MTEAVLELVNQLRGRLKTLTVDHVKEFVNWQTMEELRRKFILRMPICRMNEAAMRIGTGVYAVLFRRAKQSKR